MGDLIPFKLYIQQAIAAHPQTIALIVAAAFASTAFAQDKKDVTTKGGGKTNASTKAVKEKPQHPAPKLPEARKKEPKQPGGNVTTKRGENVTAKKGGEVKCGQK